MTKSKNCHAPAVYQIKVKGKLGIQWCEWFDGIKIKTNGSITTLTSKLIDQSTLHGILVRIRDLGLPLISLERVNSWDNNKKERHITGIDKKI
jgi:hypothetical protein